MVDEDTLVEMIEDIASDPDWIYEYLTTRNEEVLEGLSEVIAEYTNETLSTTSVVSGEFLRALGKSVFDVIADDIWEAAEKEAIDRDAAQKEYEWEAQIEDVLLGGLDGV